MSGTKNVAAALVLVVLFVPSSALTLRTASQTETDSCACMDWKDVYEGVNSADAVICGEGQEINNMVSGDRELSPEQLRTSLEMGEGFLDKFVCDLFYVWLPGKSCVNMIQGNEPGDYKNGQWCYVSSECQELNQGAKLSSHAELSWKVCGDADDQLRTKSPEELLEISTANNLDLSMLLKQSYNTMEVDRLADVKDFFQRTRQLKSVSPSSQVEKDLVELQSSGKIMVIDQAEEEQNGGKTATYVVSGGRVYEVWQKADGDKSKNGRMPGTWYAMEDFTGSH